ncbi:YitT family protein [Effusibacillus consociatus]|uniref:YitT family protein n=1 Tax=Effusibacillus consociatus TaxID=1117041 RepID=A0ABV9Q2C6_9BACL
MRYFSLILGSAMAGASMKLFLFPFNIPSGGAAGVSVLLFNLFGVPNGTGLFLLNAALLLLGYRIHGFQFVLRTLLTVSLMSLTIDLLPIGPPLRVEWLSASVGALCFGISMSIILYSGSTTGGMDILAKLIERKWGTRFGTNLFAINSAILLAAGALIGWHVTLFGISVQLLSNMMVNLFYKSNASVRVVLNKKEAYR